MSSKRPRPRPKPRAHNADAALPSTSPPETGLPNNTLSQLKDNDDFFIKNRGFAEIKAQAERMCVLFELRVRRMCSGDHAKVIERQRKRGS